MMLLSLFSLIFVLVKCKIRSVDGLSINRRRVILLLPSTCGIFNVGIATGKCNAACLQGDLSPSCIGVYKVPTNDNMMHMISTKEELQKYAPGLNFVPPIAAPSSISNAYETVLTQRLAADDIVNVVAAGRLEEAGIKVLNLLPRLSASGRALVDYENIVDKSPTSETIQVLRRLQLQNLLETAEVAWNDVDILMGQGIRGDLGVSAVAQLHILSELREATASLDEFLIYVKKSRVV